MLGATCIAIAATALLASAQNDAQLSAAIRTNESLFWNTYRPQLYHGIRPRTPHSLMTGLMWFGLNDFNGNQEIRHTCEQSDALSSYSYTRHDGRYFATQDIVDGKNGLKLTTSWLKSEDGRDWSVRVEGEASDPTNKPSRASLIYHFGLEGLGDLQLENEVDGQGLDSSITLVGSTPQLGQFRIRIVDHPNSSHLRPALHPNDFAHLTGKTNFFGLEISTGEVWRIKDHVIRAINTHAQSLMGNGKYTPESPPDPMALFVLQNSVDPKANVFAFQKNFGMNARGEQAKWGFDIFYETEGEGMDYSSLTRALSNSAAAYDVRFDQTFPLPAPFNTHEHKVFARSLTSNLVGGIGYYQGASIVDRSFKHEYDEDDDDEASAPGAQLTEERELLTATPSRSFFPRGFYWDEGFHLALIGEWDNDLSLSILKNWIALIDEDGWVAREQILGEESRSKVPSEFQTQYPSYANPPTLTMAVTAFIRRLKATHSTLDSQLGLSFSSDPSLHSLHLAHPTLAHSYLESIYPALRRHYLWFRRTQRGVLKPYGRKPPSRIEAYRWRGRTADHVLTSGLDDYPRARPPHNGELHLDLICWMGFFARTMQEISEFLSLDDVKEYQKHEQGILANLDALHWSEEENMYCDVSVNEDDESIHVCHKGYISLFPFLLGLVPPTSPHLSSILDLVTDPAELWSPYGIRSLSKAHPLFGKDENYWRGPIWVQMNWLALKALKERYMVEDGPERGRAEKVYNDLRVNVVDNVFKEWKRTGYVWEQYDAETGEGRRSHPFTGWTALVTMIMSEKYS